ncbi:MAG: SDR family oxidoreductase [Opitutaceae bacterium]|jgi:NAD(P)H dehydrogenase (quinone)
MIAITGATGQLGRLVINELLKKIPATQLVALVRTPAKAADLSALGVTVRAADYADAASFTGALAGVDKLLFISSNEIGQRVAQHRNVIEAAKRAGVRGLVYTSVLHADTSSLSLAPEHVQTEALVKASGIPYVLLRNGWYTENYTVSVPAAVAHGAFAGSAGDGRIASAARVDFAEAAAVVLTRPITSDAVYELAGDHAYTLTELAAEISRQTGKSIPYADLPEATYREILLKAGLPEGLAAGLASWDVDASKGTLFDDGHELSRLIGRPTTPLAESVRQALAAS